MMKIATLVLGAFLLQSPQQEMKEKADQCIDNIVEKGPDEILTNLLHTKHYLDIRPESVGEKPDTKIRLFYHDNENGFSIAVDRHERYGNSHTVLLDGSSYVHDWDYVKGKESMRFLVAPKAKPMQGKVQHGFKRYDADGMPEGFKTIQAYIENSSEFNSLYDRIVTACAEQK